MISDLIQSFETGDHRHFKQAQTHWVQNRSPTTETVIGFIETYQDPYGVRGAWEGIVAIVNKDQSRKFSELVHRSSEFIAVLPWNGSFCGLDEGVLSAYESDSFIKPGFTSLDTVGFVKSESPAGLNLPNFEDICQNIGSKNLQFGNVNSANPPDEKIPFVREDKLDFVRKHCDEAFEVIVACHELLGHGSGRLLVESAPEEYNFSINDPPIDPLTQRPVTLWYKRGETWSSVFGSHANAIEEYRADGVALILLTDERVLEIFGFTGTSKILADDIIYAGYLTWIYDTLQGLSRWDPETKNWGQSHRRGKFTLLRCMLECGVDVIHISEETNDLQIHLNREKIRSHIVPALSKFLLQIQVFKSTSDTAEGIPFFCRYAEVDERFARYREIVLKQEPPRIQYVQPNLVLDEGNRVRMKVYPATREGLIRSWAERSV